jgi:hypothetical protein
VNRELAEHISLLAAPVYAAILTMASPRVGRTLSVMELNDLRKAAITQAHALWLQTLDHAVD